jgi:hypothetical protein
MVYFQGMTAFLCSKEELIERARQRIIKKRGMNVIGGESNGFAKKSS